MRFPSVMNGLVTTFVTHCATTMPVAGTEVTARSILMIPGKTARLLCSAGDTSTIGSVTANVTAQGVSMMASIVKDRKGSASKSGKSAFENESQNVFVAKFNNVFFLFSPLYDQYCKDHYADGHCDQGCNNAECEWDGLDCANNMPEKLADGHLVLVVQIPPEQLKNLSSSFLRELSSVLHTNVVFRRDAKGEPMIFPYYGNEQDLVKHNVLKRSADDWPEWASMPANILGQMKESVSSMVSQRKRRELDPVQVKG